MKIVLAFDSFKECMTTFEAMNAIKDVLSHTCKGVALSDGGEGTYDVIVNSLNGYYIEEEVLDVFLKPRYVKIGIVNDMAIIESARVCGLELCQGIKNPHQTSTYGLGQLILKALNHNVKTILITLGGSATNDGGIGMLDALGVRFFDSNGKSLMMMDDLKDIMFIDNNGLDERLKDVNIIGLCDVSNPLCGINGATYIYGRQKGLSSEELYDIDQAMKHYAKKSKELLNSDEMSQGSGAAGGLGFALKSYLHASLQNGFEVISKITKLKEAIMDCDCVFTGEGQIDKSTQYGKVPYGVLKIAKEYNKKVYVFAGKVKDEDVLYDLGFDRIYEISTGIDKELALSHGQYYLQKKVLENIEEIEKDVQG